MPSKRKRKKKKAVRSAEKRSSPPIKSECQGQDQIVKILPRGVLPLVTSRSPQVSAVPEKGLVSGKPSITIPRYWGILPSRKWGKTRMPVTRKIRALRPTEVGLMETLVNVLGAPASIPTHIINGMVNFTRKMHGRAEQEVAMTPEDKIKDELLELKMRYEMNEISEDDYKKAEAGLKKRLEDIQQGREKEGPEGSPERSRAITKKKPKKRK